MIIVEKRFRYWMGILAAIFLGITFVIAAISKLFISAGNVEIPAIFLTLLGGLEITLGIFLVTCIYAKLAAICSLPLIAGFITSNILEKIYGGEECLSCFGALGKLSATQALYMDGLMVLLAIMVLYFYPGRFLNNIPWFWGKG